MIGGIVLQTIVFDDRVWVDTVEREEYCNGTCAVYVERNENSDKIKPGDSLWWQGGFAMWTPYENKGKSGNRGGIHYDIQIPKIGFSGACKPKQAA